MKIQWAPRMIMTDRLFRLPVESQTKPQLEAKAFEQISVRFSPRDKAWMFYLRSPSDSGDYALRARDEAGNSSVIDLRVRTLHEVRRPFDDGGTTWPRRWPVGGPRESRKQRQTLLTDPPSASSTVDTDRLAFWTSQDDDSLWRHLPNAEVPRAHYVNVHQGCPICGTAIFATHGFYPWTRVHAPADLRSTCPSCDNRFPSNDLLADDFTTGDFVDDGFGYFDDDGHVFLFAASSRRELVGQYAGAIRLLTDYLRREGPDRPVARQLGLMLLRWSVEEIYIAAAPQFRHGPSQEIEQAWDGGQPDWAGMEDPIAALYRKGSLAYAIDVPMVTEALSHAYDTVWPLLRDDDEWTHRATAQGLELEDATAGVHLIEEALSCLMQTAIDGAALSNKPRTSLGVLTALRALDRDDAGDVMDWLYDHGPDRMRVFVTNNFTTDGAPPEATGGYNDTHTRGVFELQEQVDALRELQPNAYPSSLYPSVTDDPRLDRLVRSPHDMVLLDHVPFHFGDGGSAGVQQPLKERQTLKPLDETTLERAAVAGSQTAVDLLARQRRDEPGNPGTTFHDGVGIAILRTDGKPERAAAGIVYGDAPWHRHQDLFDVQLYAFDRPFLSDLGYPQSWAHVGAWEGNWATHNSVWSVVNEIEPLDLPFDTPWHYLKEIAGRGRLVRVLRTDGVQIVEVEARRWVFDAEQLRWVDPGIRYRRLLALVETDEEGIALVDLSRIQGGDDHWRLCRGLEGRFVQQGVEPQSQPGTLAGADFERGADGLRHGDHAGLAWMNEVAQIDAGGARGQWTSRHDEAARLDLHQLHVSEGTRLRTARSTAVMDSPDRSRYDYHTLAWQRAAQGTTCIDLVFEPHLGDPTLADAQTISSAGADEAAGVHLTTHAGRELSIYWSPDREPDEETRFEDDTSMQGPLALVETERALTVACDGLSVGGVQVTIPEPRQTGTITHLDRRRCTIDVQGLVGIHPHDRVVVNSQGRAHNYEVTAVDQIDGGVRLTLDMDSVHGRARIVSVDGERIELDFHLITRTATLMDTRLQRESDGNWRPIRHARNADGYTTSLEVGGAPGVDGALADNDWVQPGDWVAAVDYVVGDPVRWEPEITSVLKD
ncbi:MAG: hypothetical protein QGG05_09585 [Candidatus Latescibacteria bacterium]|nr:hypothetical protein [Candidatus Latescibacterota bacterium]